MSIKDEIKKQVKKLCSGKIGDRSIVDWYQEELEKEYERAILNRHVKSVEMCIKEIYGDDNAPFYESSGKIIERLNALKNLGVNSENV